jgi:hypothetical protein
MVIIVTTMLYFELGAGRCRILKIRGNHLDNGDTPDRDAHFYGCAADLSILDLVDGKAISRDWIISHRFPKVEIVERRLNGLFPMPGSIQTATYEPDHLHVQVPSNGFNTAHQSLAAWFDDGVTGERISRV